MNTQSCKSIGSKLPDYSRQLVSSQTHHHHLQNLIPYDLFNYWAKSRNCTVKQVKTAHAHFVKVDALHADILATNSLVECYCRSASMVYARKVFDKMPQWNVFSWNVLISGYSDNRSFGDSWLTFCRMHSLGFAPDEFIFGGVLAACIALQSLLYGKLLYAFTVKNGSFSSGYLRSGMIDLLCRYSSFEDAVKLFFDISCDNVVCWNAIISGAVKSKENPFALTIFSKMRRALLSPNNFTFSSILTACATLKDLEIGKAVHGQVIKNGCREDVFVDTAIVDLYAKCGQMGEAVKEFSRMCKPNVVSWTTIISGFVQQGDSTSALKYFKDMIRLREEINNYTVTSVLAACVNSSLFIEAIQIHGWILKSNFYSDSSVKSALINLYSKLGESYLSELIFRDSEDLNDLRTWAVMISSFSKNGNLESAMDLYKRVFYQGLRPDNFCSSSVLSVITSTHLGRQVHCYTLKTGLIFDISVSSSVFTMYSKCGNIEESYEVFKQIKEKDGVSWSSMISGFAQHGHAYRAIELFRKMLSEKAVIDEQTLTAVLTACSDLRLLKMAKEVHTRILRRHYSEQVLVGGVLVNVYSKCIALNYARRVFDTMPVKDSVSCSALVSGCARGGFLEDAVQLLDEMLLDGLEIDCFTISSVLVAVALLNLSNIGKQMHSRVIKTGLDSEGSVGSSLIMMYSKCGSIEDCEKVFQQIKNQDVISWTAMIVSNGQHGKGREALKMYDEMRKSGVKPDSVTFTGLLSACSHNGLIEEGYFHLNSMSKDFGVEPNNRHYSCMVDALGRSGRLKEAEELIKNMPIKADSLVWATLLASCKVHGDVELGKVAAQKVSELDPSKSGVYVSLSNICAEVGEWDEVVKIRSDMKMSSIDTQPGLSYV